MNIIKLICSWIFLGWWLVPAATIMSFIFWITKQNMMNIEMWSDIRKWFFKLG